MPRLTGWAIVLAVALACIAGAPRQANATSPARVPEGTCVVAVGNPMLLQGKDGGVYLYARSSCSSQGTQQVTMKLQTSADSGMTWSDASTVTGRCAANSTDISAIVDTPAGVWGKMRAVATTHYYPGSPGCRGVYDYFASESSSVDR